MTLRRCLLIGSGIIDLQPLVTALAKRNIRTVSLDSLTPGKTIAQAFDSQLHSADVVCAVLSGSEALPNVYFELGLAAARKKPIFLIVDHAIDLPSDLLGFLYIRGSVSDMKVLGHQLDGVLAQLSRHRPSRPRRKAPATTFDPAQAREQLRAISSNAPGREQGRDFERWAACAFADAGISAASSASGRHAEPDLAIWVDGIDQSIGNPVLVELKYGNLSNATLRHAAADLASHLSSRLARFGLVIYFDRDNKTFDPILQKSPLIIAVSADELVTHLAAGTLAQAIIRHRNRIVHGMP